MPQVFLTLTKMFVFQEKRKKKTLFSVFFTNYFGVFREIVTSIDSFSFPPIPVTYRVFHYSRQNSKIREKSLEYEIS